MSVMSSPDARPHGIRAHAGQRLKNMPLTPISHLAPFSGLILSVIIVVLFLIRFYILEKWLLKKMYGSMYTGLDEVNRRGFLNHHIAGAMKPFILLFAAYPFIWVAFGKGMLQSRYAPGSSVRLGDILIIAAQMLIAIYIFELIYRVKISPVSVVHHIGTILIGQSAIAISLNLAREPDADIEFILCTVWGAFDIICEFLPHMAIILYRVHPTRHHFLRKLFMICCFTTFIGTVTETIVIMYLFGSLWARWQLAFKVVTPMLHLAFTACQLHGSRIFWIMWHKQARLIREQNGDNVEEGRKEKIVEDLRQDDMTQHRTGDINPVLAPTPS